MRVALVLLLLLPLVSAAQLSGTVYDYDLHKVPLSVVEVNSSPAQRMVAVNGSFSFSLAPGDYEVHVSLPKRNLTSTEVVEIDKEGAFVYDVILLPDIGDDPLLEKDEDLPFLENMIEDTPQSYAVVWVLFGIALAVAAYVMMREKKQAKPRTIVRKQVVHERVVEKVALAEDVQHVIAVLEKLGGRASQKDIRHQLPYSEAKVSLMLDELEEKGLVERIRKGRANIIVKR